MKKWGDRKDYVYYLTEFRTLKKKPNEPLADFTKRFNKIYQKIHEEIKPPETIAMITFENSLECEFALWLRGEKAQTLMDMQEAAIGVQSNLMASNKLKMEEKKAGKEKKNKRRKKFFF